ARAMADRDHVYAVVKGTAVNNDGSGKAGYTAPGVDGQREVIARALRHAGVSAREIDYIEAHGTATPLGDPIEIRALTAAFAESGRGDDAPPCAIGSVKGNVGHLDAAAGVAGLMKAILFLYHQELVPSIHFEQPNPRI